MTSGIYAIYWCLHDTAGDEIAFYDELKIPPHQSQVHQKHKQTFEAALDLNAKERSRRFASINTKNKINRVRKAINQRSVSLFEPRPELGMGLIHFVSLEDGV
ncbi:MAG: DUF2309 family protein [Sphingobacteriaceae bacterium]|nr:DUF2309 family protein [Sphingobacteriaceae bacterium]